MNVIKVQGTRLDWLYMRRWCDAHGARELLEALRLAAKVEP
jgi:hypothetical protein